MSWTKRRAAWLAVTLASGLVVGCSNQQLDVFNAKLEVSRACQTDKGGDPYSQWCKLKREELAAAQAHKKERDAGDAEQAANRKDYEALRASSPDLARYLEARAASQTDEAKAAAELHPKISWLRGEWCETKRNPSSIDLETRTYRIMDGGRVDQTTFVEKKRPIPGREPYTLSRTGEARVTPDGSVEIWHFHERDGKGSKLVDVLRKSGRKSFAQVALRVYEWPSATFDHSYSLDGGEKAVDSSYDHRFKRCSSDLDR